MTENAEDILRFWFGEQSDDASIAARQAPLWWQKKPQTDALIRKRFETAVKTAAAGALSAWSQTPDGRLALIILLDQFPRNMYRDSPRAFLCDPQARDLCLQGLERGDDLRLRPIERVFFYLPLEHAEDRALQARSVELFEALAASTHKAGMVDLSSYAEFARRHQRIIDRFGRFPHRNAILGRVSSAEEEAFLKTPGSSF
ncbi:MAG: DUF924 domain-containing protein [Pseudomonadales bacterium]|nr:DUF924 domain-containing protein [Pseudomonadales bacterium]